MILVTGATGFLGRFIVDELLSNGYEVRVLVRNPESRDLPWKAMVEVAEGDIMDLVSLERAMEGVDRVIHAAAVVSMGRRLRYEMVRINAGGTANVVDACLTAGVEKLVQISSIAAIGRTGTAEPVTEETPWKVSKEVSWYARSKYKAELEVHRGIAEGLNAVFVNPGLIIGPAADWQSGTAKIFGIVHKGLRFYNRGVSGFVGAADVARATRLVMEQDIPNGQRFLLVAESLSQQEVIATIAKSLGKKPAKWQLPAQLSLLAGFVSELWAGITGKEPIITRASMRNSIRRNYFDGSKITGLGFSYTPMKAVFETTARAFLASKST